METLPTKRWVVFCRSNRAMIIGQVNESMGSRMTMTVLRLRLLASQNHNLLLTIIFICFNIISLLSKTGEN